MEPELNAIRARNAQATLQRRHPESVLEDPHEVPMTPPRQLNSPEREPDLRAGKHRPKSSGGPRDRACAEPVDADAARQLDDEVAALLGDVALPLPTLDRTDRYVNALHGRQDDGNAVVRTPGSPAQLQSHPLSSSPAQASLPALGRLPTPSSSPTVKRAPRTLEELACPSTSRRVGSPGRSSDFISGEVLPGQSPLSMGDRLGDSAPKRQSPSQDPAKERGTPEVYKSTWDLASATQGAGSQSMDLSTLDLRRGWDSHGLEAAGLRDPEDLAKSAGRFWLRHMLRAHETTQGPLSRRRAENLAAYLAGAVSDLREVCEARGMPVHQRLEHERCVYDVVLAELTNQVASYSASHALLVNEVIRHYRDAIRKFPELLDAKDGAISGLEAARSQLQGEVALLTKDNDHARATISQLQDELQGTQKRLAQRGHDVAATRRLLQGSSRAEAQALADAQDLNVARLRNISQTDDKQGALMRKTRMLQESNGMLRRQADEALRKVVAAEAARVTTAEVEEDLRTQVTALRGASEGLGADVAFLEAEAKVLRREAHLATAAAEEEKEARERAMQQLRDLAARHEAFKHAHALGGTGDGPPAVPPGEGEGRLSRSSSRGGGQHNWEAEVALSTAQQQVASLSAKLKRAQTDLAEANTRLAESQRRAHNAQQAGLARALEAESAAATLQRRLVAAEERGAAHGPGNTSDGQRIVHTLNDKGRRDALLRATSAVHRRGSLQRQTVIQATQLRLQQARDAHAELRAGSEQQLADLANELDAMGATITAVVARSSVNPIAISEATKAQATQAKVLRRQHRALKRDFGSMGAQFNAQLAHLSSAVAARLQSSQASATAIQRKHQAQVAQLTTMHKARVYKLQQDADERVRAAQLAGSRAATAAAAAAADQAKYAAEEEAQHALSAANRKATTLEQAAAAAKWERSLISARAKAATAEANARVKAVSDSAAAVQQVAEAAEEARRAEALAQLARLEAQERQRRDAARAPAAAAKAQTSAPGADTVNGRLASQEQRRGVAGTEAGIIAVPTDRRMRPPHEPQLHAPRSSVPSTSETADSLVSGVESPRVVEERAATAATVAAEAAADAAEVAALENTIVALESAEGRVQSLERAAVPHKPKPATLPAGPSRLTRLRHGLPNGQDRGQPQPLPSVPIRGDSNTARVTAGKNRSSAISQPGVKPDVAPPVNTPSPVRAAETLTSVGAAGTSQTVTRAIRTSTSAPVLVNAHVRNAPAPLQHDDNVSGSELGSVQANPRSGSLARPRVPLQAPARAAAAGTAGDSPQHALLRAAAPTMLSAARNGQGHAQFQAVRSRARAAAQSVDASVSIARRRLAASNGTAQGGAGNPGGSHPQPGGSALEKAHDSAHSISSELASRTIGSVAQTRDVTRDLPLASPTPAAQETGSGVAEPVPTGPVAVAVPSPDRRTAEVGGAATVAPSSSGQHTAGRRHTPLVNDEIGVRGVGAAVTPGCAMVADPDEFPRRTIAPSAPALVPRPQREPQVTTRLPAGGDATSYDEESMLAVSDKMQNPNCGVSPRERMQHNALASAQSVEAMPRASTPPSDAATQPTVAFAPDGSGGSAPQQVRSVPSPRAGIVQRLLQPVAVVQLHSEVPHSEVQRGTLSQPLSWNPDPAKPRTRAANARPGSPESPPRSATCTPHQSSFTSGGGVPRTAAGGTDAGPTDSVRLRLSLQLTSTLSTETTPLTTLAVKAAPSHKQRARQLRREMGQDKVFRTTPSAALAPSSAQDAHHVVPAAAQRYPVTVKAQLASSSDTMAMVRDGSLLHADPGTSPPPTPPEQ